MTQHAGHMFTDSVRALKMVAYSDTREAQGAIDRNSISYRISRYGINLPCGMDMTEEKIIYVCDCLKECLLASNQD